MPAVNPSILRWARETAGLSTEAAAKKLGLKKTKAGAPAERLQELEEGRAEPPRSVLLRMSATYFRPLLTFYLESPPAKADRGADFRSLRDRSADSEQLVDALVRDIRSRQLALRSVVESDEDAKPIPLVGSCSVADDVAKVAASIKTSIRFDLRDYRKQRPSDKAFNYLRTRVEAAGVFVVLVGNLGSHHTAVGLSAFRGFAVADPVAPLVAINDHDAPAAWSFTLLHELAHLALGQTGISGTSAESKIEKFCNAVASSILLPDEELDELAVHPGMSDGALRDLIANFARARNISHTMVAFRLFNAKAISSVTWESLADFFRTQFLANRESDREKKRSSKSQGPDYYVVKRQRLGQAVMHVVDRAIREGELAPTRAAHILGVKPHKIEKLLSGKSEAA